jgi:hypothetical protein
VEVEAGRVGSVAVAGLALGVRAGLGIAVAAVVIAVVAIIAVVRVAGVTTRARTLGLRVIVLVAAVFDAAVEQVLARIDRAVAERPGVVEAVFIVLVAGLGAAIPVVANRDDAGGGHAQREQAGKPRPAEVEREQRDGRGVQE